MHTLPALHSCLARMTNLLRNGKKSVNKLKLAPPISNVAGVQVPGFFIYTLLRRNI